MGINTVRIGTLVSLLSCMFGHSMSALGHFYASPYDRIEEDIKAFRTLVVPSRNVGNESIGRGDIARYDLPDADELLKVTQDLGAGDALAKHNVHLDADHLWSSCMDMASYADAAKNELSLALYNADECIKELKNNPEGNVQSPSNACKYFYMHRDSYNALRNIVASVMRICEYEKSLPYMEVKSEYRLLNPDSPGRRRIDDGHEEENAVDRLEQFPPLDDIEAPLVIAGASSPGDDPSRPPKGGKESDDDDTPRKRKSGWKPFNGGSGGGGDDDGDDGYHGNNENDDDDEYRRRKRNAYILDYYLKNYKFINYKPETSGYSALQLCVTGLIMALAACAM